MTSRLFRVTALALLAGFVWMPAQAASGAADAAPGVRPQLRKPLPQPEVAPLPDEELDPLPEEEQPAPVRRKRESRQDNGVPVDRVDPVQQDDAPEPRRRPRQEYAEPETNDEYVAPRRRRSQPEFVEPAPEEEMLPRRRRQERDFYEPGPGPDRAGPSADQIERQLEARPRIRLAPEKRVTIREFQRRPDLRRAAPSIDIQAINFATGSAEIPVSQYRKVENIGIALERLLRRDPDTLVLIEGHTDAVGSSASNQLLSERRAASLKRLLVREFGIPREALETVGYGEEYLLIPTSSENWKNRRVTLRSIDEFVR